MKLTSRGRRSLRYGFALAALLALGAGGWLWFRDSSFVQVRDVQITGVTASDGARVRAALESAALGMTTLNVRPEVLRDATASYTSVGSLKVQADFPHGLAIQVVERRAVAAVAGDSERRVPVTGDGVLLRGVSADRDLPSIVLAHPTVGPRVTDRRALRALAIAGAAPAPLLQRTDQLEIGSRGVVLALRDGPELVFGTDEDAAEKWIAAARVLAEPSARGATYLDLRIPGRVAAGGLAPLSAPEPESNLLPEAENDSTVDP